MPSKTRKVSYKDNDIPKVSLKILNDDFASETSASNMGGDDANIVDLEKELMNLDLETERKNIDIDKASAIQLGVMAGGLYSFILTWIFIWMMLVSFNPSWVRYKDPKKHDVTQVDYLKALGWSLLFTFILGMVSTFLAYKHVRVEM